MSWDPYAALGVSKSASEGDIRKAYRKLAKELHPDVRPNDAASAERFKRLTAAFNLLSDPTERSRFDRGEIDADGSETPMIDAEAETDRTAAGRRHAAAASAARPQEAVKQAAWEQVVEDDTLANVTARSIIVGFVRPGQAELLKPFRDKYFGAISGVWQRRSSEVAQTVVVGLYPSWDISQEGLDAADEFLSDPDVPPSLRRLVLEGRAGVERSLRARQFDVS